jgi:hypothetical protein
VRIQGGLDKILAVLVVGEHPLEVGEEYVRTEQIIDKLFGIVPVVLC